MSLHRLSILALVLATAGCVGRQPHAFLPPIAEEYYACAKCGSLHGGIYGKGPLASFAAKDGSSCRHHWEPLSKAEFQKTAEADFPSEWAKSLPFFKTPAP